MPGIQKLIELEISAYDLFTTKMHSSGLSLSVSRCSAVVYQPKKIGVNDISAGSIQTLASMKPTVRWVMYSGYSRGRTMAKYLRKKRKGRKRTESNKQR